MTPAAVFEVLPQSSHVRCFLRRSRLRRDSTTRVRTRRDLVKREARDVRDARRDAAFAARRYRGADDIVLALEDAAA